MVCAALPMIAACAGRKAPDESAQRIPRDASRFEIESVDDSIARFLPYETRWLRVGTPMYAVDPARRDALVARLRVVGMDSGRVRALVVSQTTRLTTNHFLLAVEPKRAFYQTKRFWGTLFVGAGLGVAGSR